MGEARKDALRVNFDRKLKIEFHGVKVTSGDLSLLDANMQPVVEPGRFEVMVDGLKKCFKVI